MYIYIYHFIQKHAIFYTIYTTTNACMLTATYFIAESFIEILVSAPWRWRDNNAVTCRKHVGAMWNTMHKKYRIMHFMLLLKFLPYMNFESKLNLTMKIKSKLVFWHQIYSILTEDKSKHVLFNFIYCTPPPKCEILKCLK